jgi:hypothetical protein
MKIASIAARLLGLLIVTVSLGCAAAYHDYSECQVNCRYCVPPPLPYTHYDECVCHSCAASKYLTDALPPAPAQVDPLNDLE